MQLEGIGYNIGVRLIEDFLSRSALVRCADFREVGEVVAKVWIVALHWNIASAQLCTDWIQIISQYYSYSDTQHVRIHRKSPEFIYESWFSSTVVYLNI